LEAWPVLRVAWSGALSRHPLIRSSPTGHQPKTTATITPSRPTRTTVRSHTQLPITDTDPQQLSEEQQAFIFIILPAFFDLNFPATLATSLLLPGLAYHLASPSWQRLEEQEETPGHLLPSLTFAILAFERLFFFISLSREEKPYPPGYYTIEVFLARELF
jgi:hypothetical protein